MSHVNFELSLEGELLFYNEYTINDIITEADNQTTNNGVQKGIWDRFKEVIDKVITWIKTEFNNIKETLKGNPDINKLGNNSDMDSKFAAVKNAFEQHKKTVGVIVGILAAVGVGAVINHEKLEQQFPILEAAENKFQNAISELKDSINNLKDGKNTIGKFSKTVWDNLKNFASTIESYEENIKVRLKNFTDYFKKKGEEHPTVIKIYNTIIKPFAGKMFSTIMSLAASYVGVKIFSSVVNG